MELELFHKKTVGDVKRQFARNFPYLKLEIFSLPLASRNASLMQQRLKDTVSLDQIKTFCHEGAFSFQPSITVAAFKSLLQDRFGLSVLVFRRAGDLWPQTVQTDNLPLEKQNGMGEAACRPVRANPATLFL